MTVKGGGGSVMLWSAITYAGVGWLCNIEGTMNRYLFKQILEEDLELTINHTLDKLGYQRNQIIFQHDNDPKHTSDLVKEYLLGQDYKVMDWPPQSPDLNPIENMWALLKRRLNEYETAPKGILDLSESVTDVWYNTIKQAECQKVIDSMPNRIKQCLERNGLWTDY
jgi:hypothetical protein